MTVFVLVVASVPVAVSVSHTHRRFECPALTPLGLVEILDAADDRLPELVVVLELETRRFGALKPPLERAGLPDGDRVDIDLDRVRTVLRQRDVITEMKPHRLGYHRPGCPLVDDLAVPQYPHLGSGIHRQYLSGLSVPKRRHQVDAASIGRDDLLAFGPGDEPKRVRVRNHRRESVLAGVNGWQMPHGLPMGRFIHRVGRVLDAGQRRGAFDLRVRAVVRRRSIGRLVVRFTGTARKRSDRGQSGPSEQSASCRML